MIAIMIPTPIMTRLLCLWHPPSNAGPSSAWILPILFMRRLDMIIENSYGPIAEVDHSP